MAALCTCQRAWKSVFPGHWIKQGLATVNESMHKVPVVAQYDAALLVKLLPAVTQACQRLSAGLDKEVHFYPILD